MRHTAFVIGLLPVLFAARAQAGLITVNWSGFVSDATTPTGISSGDIIAGEFTYDNTAPISQSLSYFAEYDTNHISFFTLNGLSGSRTGNSIAVINDSPSGGYDQFDSRGQFDGSGGVYTGDLIGGQSVNQIFVPFNDYTGTALSDTSLPSMLDPNDFGIGVGRLQLSDGSDIQFRVTDFSFSAVNPVPEPSSLILSGMALMSLAGYGWRRAQAPSVLRSEQVEVLPSWWGFFAASQ